MKYDHILFTYPDPDFYSGTQSPRKLILEGGGIIPIETSVSDEDESETDFESEAESDTFSQNAYETFIAPNPKKGDGFSFPRR